MNARRVPAKAGTTADQASHVLIMTQGLTTSFDGHVDLDVRCGEILIGPKGAGKSTRIKMLRTLLPPTSGEAQIAGCDLAHEARCVRAHIDYVPQLLSADGALTSRERLTLSGRSYLLPRQEQERAQEIYPTVFNSAWTQYADRGAKGREEIAHRAAWAAVEHRCRKGGEQWVER